MIYEVRTYTLKPGSVQAYEESFAEALPERVKFSPLAAFWHTEIGPLNQIIHVWPYENMEHRNSCRKEAVNKGLWPPNTGDCMVNMNTEFWIPVSFSPEMRERNIGPFFEMRIYTYPPGQIEKILPAWEEKIEERKKLSDLVGAYISEVGNVNKFMHIWAYKDLQQRTESRKKFSEIGWPPKSEAKPPIKMENKILLPSNFSPIK